ncbi:MAG: hypothetical protein Q7J48_13330 [Nocardioides sp.]|nr:hypothetical protein [Nocardioides sp.]
MLIAGIAAIVAIAAFALGGQVNELFTDTCDEFDAQSSVTATC